MDTNGYKREKKKSISEHAYNFTGEKVEKVRTQIHEELNISDLLPFVATTGEKKDTDTND